VEAAAAKSVFVVDLVATVNSSRGIETVRDLLRRLKPYDSVDEVQRFNARAAQLLGLAAQAK
jgi:hypothetical protein